MANEYHMHYVVSFKDTLLLSVITMFISSILIKKSDFQNIGLMEFNCRIESNTSFFNFFSCGAVAQRGPWSPHS